MFFFPTSSSLFSKLNFFLVPSRSSLLKPLFFFIFFAVTQPSAVLSRSISVVAEDDLWWVVEWLHPLFWGLPAWGCCCSCMPDTWQVLPKVLYLHAPLRQSCAARNVPLSNSGAQRNTAGWYFAGLTSCIVLSLWKKPHTVTVYYWHHFVC